MRSLKKVAEIESKFFAEFNNAHLGIYPIYEEHLYVSPDGRYYGVYWNGGSLTGREPKSAEGLLLTGTIIDIIYNDRDLLVEGDGRKYFRDLPSHVQRVYMDHARGNRGECGVVEYTETEATEWLDYENQNR